jgi:hypothetical protein
LVAPLARSRFQGAAFLSRSEALPARLPSSRQRYAICRRPRREQLAPSQARCRAPERRSPHYEGHRRNDEQGAPPAIISVQNFVDVQLLRRSRGGVARPTLERSRTKTSHHYALGGRFRCGYCQRRMEGAARRFGLISRRSHVLGQSGLFTLQISCATLDKVEFDPQVEATMRRLVCVFRRHDWHSEYNHATKRTTWTCRRCGAHKLTADGFLNVGDSGGPGPGGNPGI